MSTKNSSSQDTSDGRRSHMWRIRTDLQRLFFLAPCVGASDSVIHPSTFEALSHSRPPEHLSYASATVSHPEDEELNAAIDGILSVAAEESFEDGMESKTSLLVYTLVSWYAAAGVQQLTARLTSPGANQGVAADVVRALGQIDDVRSHSERIYTAECLLYSPLPFARDAGSIALVDLADSGSIPALRSAVEREPIPELKDDMRASLEELVRETDAVRSQEA